MFRNGIVLGAMIALAACGSPGGGNSFVTREGASVSFSPDGNSFTVAFRAGARVSDYWCAAGRAAQGRVPPSTRIYLTSQAGFPAGQSPSFSFVEPPGGGQPTGIATIGNSTSLSASQAQSQCGLLPVSNR